MKVYKFLLFLPMFLLLSSWTQSLEKKDNLIIWSSAYKLVWSDFRGRPDPNQAQNAQTFYGFEVEKNYVISYQEKVTSYVDRSKSWVKDTIKGSLRHEQLHFDIAEVYARKMREYLANLPERGFEKREQLVTKQTTIFFDDMQYDQNHYDIDTNHGLIEEKQKEWEVKVKGELDKYKFFK